MSDFKLGPLQEQWLQSLEQHPERQGKNVLGTKNEDGTYTACCLGEYGLIAGVCRWEGTMLVDECSPYYLSESYKELGLYSHNGESRLPEKESLAYMNDSGKTWPEIAAIIRANPEEYLNKSI